MSWTNESTAWTYLPPEVVDLFPELNVLQLDSLQVLLQSDNSLLTTGLGGLQPGRDLLKHLQLGGHFLQLSLGHENTCREKIFQ